MNDFLLSFRKVPMDYGDYTNESVSLLYAVRRHEMELTKRGNSDVLDSIL